MVSSDKDQKGVTTVQTALNVLGTIHRFDGARVTELADELGMAKSSIHRHLRTLRKNEYVVKEGDEYNLGLQFAILGRYVIERKQVYRLAEAVVEQLAVDTDERAQFFVEEHGEVVYVHRTSGERAVPADSEIGKRLPIHATAAGKVILANYPPNRVNEILSRQGLPPTTAYTITDREEFSDELDAVAERGYAFNRQESKEGLRSVAVPVCDHLGQVLGALSITGPLHRMKKERFSEELPDVLRGAANEIEVNLKYS